MKQDYGNAFVGISLCNKVLDRSAVERINKLAFEELAARKIVYLIADEIDMINRRVFEGGLEETNRQKIAERSIDLEGTIKASAVGVQKFRVSSARWTDILSNHYWKLYFKIFELYCRDAEFRQDTLQVAALYAQRRAKSISKSALCYLGQYLLSEMPTLIQGIEIAGKTYSTAVYPSYKLESMELIIDRLWSGHYDLEIDTVRCKIVQIEI